MLSQELGAAQRTSHSLCEVATPIIPSRTFEVNIDVLEMFLGYLVVRAMGGRPIQSALPAVGPDLKGPEEAQLTTWSACLPMIL